MKKIEKLVKGITEEVKAQFKVERIKNAIKSARLNAEEELAIAKSELQCLDGKELSANEIVDTISNAIDKVENAEATLTRIQKIEDYLNTEEA